MAGQGIKVVGLDELRRELRKLDEPGIIDGLKDVNYQVARDVIGWSQAAAGRFGPMDARAAATLTASKAQRAAQVKGGGARAPWFGGSEFGAGRNRDRSTSRGVVTGWNQFREWRGNGRDAGYWLYPSIRAHTDEIVDRYGEGLERLTARAFPD